MKFLVLLALLSGISTNALANEVVLSASADNTIYAEDGGLSNGSGDFLLAGVTNDDTTRRALIWFDISAAVPVGSTIDSVTLTLNLVRTRAEVTPVLLHRVGSAWGEGSSHASANEGQGASAKANDATWTHRIWPNTMWTTPGGDYVTAASSTTPVDPRAGPQSWNGAGLASDVQSWLDAPAQNFGWILVGDESQAQTAMSFDSRSSSTPSGRPALRVTFTANGPAGACCRPDGACGELADPGAGCADYQGLGSVCSATSCPQPNGACCIPNAAATCAEVTEAECLGQNGAFAGGLTSCASRSCPVVLTPFVDPLPLPAIATPSSGEARGLATYNMSIVELEQQLHSELPPTKVWGFSDGTAGSFPGPTIEASSGLAVTVTWANDLRDDTGALRQEHVLNVDLCAHGANDQSPRTVVHLHGGHVPAAYDGYPESTSLPGESATYEYPNDQQAATIWYHDHALGITRLNVYMGLAGFYLIRDEAESALALPAGPFEVPLVIQDRTFAPNGQLVYPADWQQHFFGDTLLVNGKVWPFLSVVRGKYRFRLLNGSGSRTYTLALSNGSRFDVIGTDGGLLPAPVGVGELTIMPGERYDIVIDFEPFPAGTQIVLENSASAPYPGPRGKGVVRNVMQFFVGSELGHTSPLPQSLRPVEPIPQSESVVTRDFELERTSDSCSGSKWLINGLGWDDITERPRLGTTEIWRFINKTGISHPMHMHLVFFQVLDHQKFEIVNDVVTPVGPPLAPRPTEAGWHDTIEVGPNDMVRVIARFEDYTGKFAYHCHILEHEDHEMMRQFETFTECGDGVLGMPDEACDDGNLVDGDGCESDCTLAVPMADMGTSDMPTEDAGPAADMLAADIGVQAPRRGCCRVASTPAPVPVGALATFGLLCWRRRRRAPRGDSRDLLSGLSSGHGEA